MQVVILCGGKGTRLSELTEEIPKPLVEVGDKPILHHLMDLYAKAGHKDFILCLGYKGDKIKEHFKNNKDWNIDFVDTGEDSNKAERLMKVKDKIKDDNFLLSYGDDLSDVDINKVIELHKEKKKIVTLTAVKLQSPFGVLGINKNQEVTEFREKPRLKELMNGGFYVMKKEIFNHIKLEHDLEKDTLKDLAKEEQIIYYEHDGFWKSMNTLKDVIELNELYEEGDAPWIK